MKLKLLFLNLFAIGFLQAQCPVGDIIINGQTEMDDFVTNYGTCTTIDGYLWITGSVTDISGLSNITTINGTLHVRNTSALTILTGLQNLATVTENISIQDNQVLLNLNELAGITSSIMTLFITGNNYVLNDISAVLNFNITGDLLLSELDDITTALSFPNMTVLGPDGNPSGLKGGVRITDCTFSSISFPNLISTGVAGDIRVSDSEMVSISAPLLETIGDDLNLDSANDELTNVDFSALLSIGSYFSITDTGLADLSGFPLLETIGGSIVIERNPNLTSLTAAASLALGSAVYDIRVRDNPLLPNLDGLESATSVQYISIRDNSSLTNINGLQNITELISMGTISDIDGNTNLGTLNLLSLRNVTNSLEITAPNLLQGCGLYDYINLGDGFTTLTLNGPPNWIEPQDVLDHCPGYTNILDSNFEQALIDLGIDSENVLDGQVLTTDINTVTTLDVENKDIADLTGIEAFIALEVLNVRRNALSELDISNNIALKELTCSNSTITGSNQFTTLDITQNINLEVLVCRNVGLQSIDLSQNSLLKELNLDDNLLLTLDVSANTALTNFSCDDNQLSTIDVTSNIALIKFSCDSNQLNNLDVTQNINLTALYCYYNPLGSLNISQNTLLEDLDCTDNSLTSLDVSQNPLLKSLYCGDNQISSLITTSLVNLEYLDCTFNLLTILDVSQNAALKGLFSESNLLTSLDISQNPLIEEFTCQNNLLDSLNLKNGNNTNISNFECKNNSDLYCISVDDVSYMESNYSSTNDKDTQASYILDCNDYTQVPDDNFEQTLIDLMLDDVLDNLVLTANINTVTTLDVEREDISDLTGIEGFVELRSLMCSSNFFTSIDISKNTKLTTFECIGGSLESLDITQNTALVTLICLRNNIESLNLSQNINLETLYTGSNPIMTLDVSNNTALTYLNCNENQLSILDVTNNVLLETLICYENSISTLDVSNNPNLTEITCRKNTLNTLDVSNNILLETLDFSNNGLTEIDVTNNPELDVFYCYGNSLSTLDVTQNPDLYELYCEDNLLTSLDVSQNTGLSYLFCDNNQITSLDISLTDGISEFGSANNLLTDLTIGSSYDEFVEFNVTGNPSLFCISVDDDMYMGGNFGAASNIDGHTLYKVNCGLYTSVPDDNFEQALIALGHDDVLDNLVLTSNISALTSLDVHDKNIADLTGIEDFVSLTYLSCKENALTSLDVSQNIALDRLNCGSNFITELDVTNNPLLEELGCYLNNLTEIDLSQNTSLIELVIYENNLTEIDISNNIKLMLFDISENQLLNLDVSQNVELFEMSCAENALKHLDISGVPALTGLSCGSNQLVSLNLKNREDIIIFGFEAYDNPNLTCIEVDDVTYAINSWTDIDPAASYSENCNTTYVPDDNFEQALIDLMLDDVLDDLVATTNINTLTSLDVRHYNINDLTGIEDFTALNTLHCAYNNLTSIDITQNTGLTTFNAYDNDITSIDLSQNILLRTLRLDGNALNSLDVSVNINLVELLCAANNLTSLDVSANTNLEELLCYSNEISSLNITQNTLLTRLTCYSNQLTNLDLSANTNLDFLDCADNKITTLDLSNNTVLANLTIADNLLTRIDLSHNILLESFYAEDNQLSSLNLSLNTALTQIDCNYNVLTSLNIANGNNDVLTNFEAVENPNLSCIKVDDDVFMTANFSTGINGMASFSTNCDDICAIVGNLEIRGQAAMDAFAGMNYSCNTIDGDLRIFDEVTDMSALSIIEVVTGSLIVESNASLATLNGLQNITSVGKGIHIQANSVLDNLNELSNISSAITTLNIIDNNVLNNISSVLDLEVTMELRLSDLPSLTNAISFSNITALTDDPGSSPIIEGSVFLRNNGFLSISFPKLTVIDGGFEAHGSKLTSISAPLLETIGIDLELSSQSQTLTSIDFSSLTHIGDDLIIEETGLANLNGLSALETVTDKIEINVNRALTSLNALSSLTSISASGTGRLIIEDNTLLTNLDGLEAVNSLAVLRINYNDLLENIDALANLTELTSSTDESIIDNSIALETVNLLHLQTVNNTLTITAPNLVSACGLYSYISTGNGSTTLTLNGSANWKSPQDVLDNCMTTYVPDDNFEQALIDLGYDFVLDDYVLTANINALTSLDISNNTISDLTGIEDFIALTNLNCENNTLSDLSIVTANLTSLTTLVCGTNLFETLDLSSHSTLTNLSCGNSPNLTYLNLSNGNNTNMTLNAVNSPNLSCIEVDAAVWSASNWMDIDANSTFVESQAECDATFEESIVIYPNPVGSMLFIDTNILKIKRLRIYDAVGREIIRYSENPISILMDSYASGIYFLKVELENGDVFTKQILKK